MVSYLHNGSRGRVRRQRSDTVQTVRTAIPDRFCGHLLQAAKQMLDGRPNHVGVQQEATIVPTALAGGHHDPGAEGEGPRRHDAGVANLAALDQLQEGEQVSKPFERREQPLVLLVLPFQNAKQLQQVFIEQGDVGGGPGAAPLVREHLLDLVERLRHPPLAREVFWGRRVVVLEEVLSSGRHPGTDLSTSLLQSLLPFLVFRYLQKETSFVAAEENVFFSTSDPQFK